MTDELIQAKVARIINNTDLALNKGADDGVGHAAAGLAGRRRGAGEEVERQTPRALGHEVTQDEEERQQRRDDRQHHEPDHQVAHRAAEDAPIHSARLPAPDPRATRQIRSRAPAFTSTVTTKPPKVERDRASAKTSEVSASASAPPYSCG